LVYNGIGGMDMTNKPTNKTIKNMDQLIYTLFFIVTVVVEYYSAINSIIVLIPFYIIFTIKRKKGFFIFLADGYLVNSLIAIRLIRYFELNEFLFPFLIINTVAIILMAVFLYSKGVSSFRELKEKTVNEKILIQ